MRRRTFLGRAALASAWATASRSPTADAQPTASRFVATHFASPSGAGRHDGSRGNEWTLAEAYANATAGSRVQFSPGTYLSFSGPRRQDALTPAHNGTATEPIVFFAEHPAVYHRANPERHTTWVSDFKAHGLGSVTGHSERASGGHYVVWDGLSMRQVNGAWNSGELGVVSLFAGGQLNVKFLRCLFDQQGEGQREPGNNWGAVFIQQTSGIEFADCVFTNIPGSHGDENAMPVVTYATGELEIHHCEFLSNSGGSVFLKGVQAGSRHDNRPVRLHHCQVRGFTSHAIGLGAIGQNDIQAGRYCDIFQNVFSPAPGGLGLSLWWRDLSGGTAPRNVRFVNNTLVGSIPDEGGEEGLHRLLTISDSNDVWRDCMFMNNIVQHDRAGTNYAGIQYGARTEVAFKKLRSDHNCFSPGFGDYAGMSLADWKRLGNDRRTYIGNPRFVGVKSGDYRLAPDSPLRAGGSSPGLDVLNLLKTGAAAINMGAYVTPDQSDSIGLRPQSVTASLPLTWTWPYA